MIARPDTDLTSVAKAIANEARCCMLLRLMDGQEHTARALAEAAGVSGSAATAHLRHLQRAGLVCVTVVGRQRLHRLSTPAVAHAVEALAQVTPLLPERSDGPAGSGRPSHRLRYARACYAHLGGTLAVVIAQRLRDDGVVAFPAAGSTASGQVVVSAQLLDHVLVRDLGITQAPTGQVPAARPCVDWTERQPHLAGWLGAQLLAAMLGQGWLRRHPSDRSMVVTRAGDEAFRAVGILPLPEPNR